MVDLLAAPLWTTLTGRGSSWPGTGRLAGLRWTLRMSDLHQLAFQPAALLLSGSLWHRDSSRLGCPLSKRSLAASRRWCCANSPGWLRDHDAPAVSFLAIAQRNRDSVLACLTEGVAPTLIAVSAALRRISVYYWD